MPSEMDTDSTTTNLNSLVVLNHDNFLEWKNHVISSLGAKRAWRIVNGEERKPNYQTPEWIAYDELDEVQNLSKEDRDAINRYCKNWNSWHDRNELVNHIMLMSVGTDFKGLVDSEVPATDNWKALMAYGATRNTGLAACPLITEIFTMKYIPGTPMMQHLNKLSLIRKKLTNAGQPVPDFYYSVAMIMLIPNTADHLEWKAVTSTISLTSNNAKLFKPDVIRTKLLDADATIN
ncbi:hypothetical protein FRC02_002968 [Tulasnella sp. 418]|nr:hypothetical protein FRC02_002968 [Tulasnella sp. 418]